jgi:hypothetical protein
MKETFQTLKKEVKIMLPKSEMTPQSAQRLIRRYTAAIEGNFVAWMGATAISARSIQGRYAASENLWVEMKDDHAGMLHAFARDAQALPSAEDFAYVEEVVEHVRGVVAEMSGLKNLTLMAILENTSAEFIPLLESLAKSLGSTNLKYTLIHGEADIVHADQFSWAVEYEKAHYENPQKEIADATNMTIRFLERIFKVS